MMILTAKVDFKKIMLILVAVSAVLLSVILVFGRKDSQATSAMNVSANDSRVQFLKEKGWEVTPSPKESGQVRIPEGKSEAFDRYNALQKDQGCDLTEYAGKKVMRYVYEVTNYPGATEPVYATVLVCKNKIIGGDITNTAPNGKMHGFAKPISIPQPTQESSEPEPSEDSE